MKFTLNRDKLVTSTKGHSIDFKKDEPTHVPPEMHAEVTAVGALPSKEGDKPDLEPDQDKGNVEPTEPHEREAAIMEAFATIAESDVRDNFTATGMPTAAALQETLGWKVDSKERDPLWAKFMQKKG